MSITSNIKKVAGVAISVGFSVYTIANGVEGAKDLINTGKRVMKDMKNKDKK